MKDSTCKPVHEIVHLCKQMALSLLHSIYAHASNKEDFVPFTWLVRFWYLLHTVESHKFNVLGTRDFISKYQKFEL